MHAYYTTMARIQIVMHSSFFFHRYGFSPAAINSYSGFRFSCTGSEASLSACSRFGSGCTTDEVDFAIAVECGATAGGGAGAGSDSTMLQYNTAMLLISLVLAVVIKGYVLCD